MANKLNVGCGEFHKLGYVNMDFYSIREPDVKHDIESIPWPFEDGSFDLVECDHALEHVNKPFAVMNEIIRVTKPGGAVVVRVPHFSRGFTHADHRRGFDVSFPLYFCSDHPAFRFSDVRLKHIKTTFTWFAQPYLKKQMMSFITFWVGKLFGCVFDFFANLQPWLCSRFWCFWVGGFEQIEFVLYKPRNKIY